MITLVDFGGVWQLSRQIEDLSGTASGSFDGEATFAVVDDQTLHYREVGLLRLDSGQKMRAERGYVWQSSGVDVQVLFADGRPFHRFGLGVAASADHWCDPDTYKVTYEFGDWPSWQSVWRVTGPRKDYVMRSTYIR